MADLLERLKAALADRYTIDHEIGRGGMATVYLAQDLKHERQVAVKVMRPELAAILGGERFLREIRIAAKLDHPHILALYDSGEADGFLYYVMPHVEGLPPMCGSSKISIWEDSHHRVRIRVDGLRQNPHVNLENISRI